MSRPAWSLYAYQLIEPDEQLDLFACQEVRVHLVTRQLELGGTIDRTLWGLGYGMPALTLNGKGLISVMRAKKHIGLYPFSGAVVSEFVDAVAAVPGTSSDKGTIRFQPENPLPDDLVRELVRVRRGLIVGA